MEREIKTIDGNSTLLADAIVNYRDQTLKNLGDDKAPNLMPHTILFGASMLHGAAQALAILVSSRAEELADEYQSGQRDENSGPVVLTAENAHEFITDDTVTFASLLTLRCHTLMADGLTSEISPNVFASTIDDFKKLRGRSPVGIASGLLKMAADAKTLPRATNYNTLGGSKH